MTCVLFVVRLDDRAKARAERFFENVLEMGLHAADIIGDRLDDTDRLLIVKDLARRKLAAPGPVAAKIASRDEECYIFITLSKTVFILAFCLAG